MREASLASISRFNTALWEEAAILVYSPFVRFLSLSIPPSPPLESTCPAFGAVTLERIKSCHINAMKENCRGTLRSCAE
jgi:hypothetical protein